MERKIMKDLLAWKDRADRKPLLLHGARQVGKTYLLQKLGREHFENMVYVNLEKNLSVAGFFQDNIDPLRLLRYLEASTQEKIIPGKTLIVLDEIQACERALTSLKYFCEETPEYHVAAAGSLLGVAIHREKYSFPVGKVETCTLFPFLLRPGSYTTPTSTAKPRTRSSLQMMFSMMWFSSICRNPVRALRSPTSSQ